MHGRGFGELIIQEGDVSAKVCDECDDREEVTIQGGVCFNE